MESNRRRFVVISIVESLPMLEPLSDEFANRGRETAQLMIEICLCRVLNDIVATIQESFT